MGRILMTWELGGGLGHLIPLRDIAQKLMEQGHQVALAARELTHVPMVFGDMPVTLFQAPFQQGICPGGVYPAATFAHILFNTGFGNPLSIQAHCHAWQSIFKAWNPDFVLFDHSPMAMLAARDCPFRRATIGSGFWLPTRTSGIPDGRTWQDSDPVKLANDEIQTLNSVNTDGQWQIGNSDPLADERPSDSTVYAMSKVDNHFTGTGTVAPTDDGPSEEASIAWTGTATESSSVFVQSTVNSSSVPPGR